MTLATLINPKILQRHEEFKLNCLAKVEEDKVINIEYTIFK